MNFIIYEDEINFIECYKTAIFSVIGDSKLNYEITKILKYDNKTKNQINSIDGKKIYILDVEVPGKNGIEFAREIRKNGDWVSPIIVVTSHDEFKNVGYTSKILMLDFISKDGDIQKHLRDSLELALEINSCRPSISFLSKGEIFQILYQDIYYIEKNLNDNSSIIVTKEKEYQIRKSITNLEIELDDDSFFKTHRSCIVNLKNVKHIDFEHNIISFGDKKIDLLSRPNKSKLKKRMGVEKNVYPHT